MKKLLIFLLSAANCFGQTVQLNVTGPGSGSGGNATNALIEGPGGVYDASLVTNVQSTALVGVIPTGILTYGATNQAGHLLVTVSPAAGVTNRYVSYNGNSLTNLALLKSLSSTNGYWTYTSTADGETNAQFTITNLPAAQLTGWATNNTSGNSSQSTNLANWITNFDIYVSPFGNDSNVGYAPNYPLATPSAAIAMAVAGQTIILMDGTNVNQLTNNVRLLVPSGVNFCGMGKLRSYLVLTNYTAVASGGGLLRPASNSKMSDFTLQILDGSNNTSCPLGAYGTGDHLPITNSLVSDIDIDSQGQGFHIEAMTNNISMTVNNLRVKAQTIACEAKCSSGGPEQITFNNLVLVSTNFTGVNSVNVKGINCFIGNLDTPGSWCVVNGGSATYSDQGSTLPAFAYRQDVNMVQPVTFNGFEFIAANCTNSGSGDINGASGSTTNLMSLYGCFRADGQVIVETNSNPSAGGLTFQGVGTSPTTLKSFGCTTNLNITGVGTMHITNGVIINSQ